MLDHVQTLAEVPADPFRSHGQIYSAEVISFRGSSTRKTSELALAVNNIGVNVYDVCDRLLYHYPIRSLKQRCDPVTSMLHMLSHQLRLLLVRHFRSS